MGKLDSTGTLAQTRGRQGGLVVSSNASGGYARAWFMPRNPRTPAQLAWAKNWQAWAREWSGLTAGERSDWETAAQDSVWTRADWFGQSYQPSGLNLWMMICSLRVSLGLSLDATPPSGTPPVRDITCVMDLSTVDPVSGSYLCFVTATQGAPEVWSYIQIEASFLISSKGAARNKPFRPLVASVLESSTLIDCTSRTNELFGWFYYETNCWYRWRGWSSDLIPGPWEMDYATPEV